MSKLTIVMMLLLVPGVLYAHVYLRSTDPADGAELSSCPGKVTMTFVGSVEPAFSKLEVFDPDGKKVSKEPVFRDSDSVMEVELIEGLKPGKYTAEWLCMSLDGHKQKGSFTFTIK
jgi:methionine-rich copper-binding protein CopC